MTVLLLAMKTGWSEQQILDLPAERLETYVDLLNQLYSKK